MKSTLIITGCLFFSTAFGQLTNTTSEPTAELSDRITHYDLPVQITTNNGEIHNGQIRYKEYGSKKLYFSPEGSVNDEFILIDESAGFDSIQKLVINHEKLKAKYTYCPVLLDEKNEGKTLVQQVEDNGAYTEVRLFQSTKNSFSVSDKPAPSNSSIPGAYDYFLLNKRTGEYIRKNYLASMNKNVTKFVDYCDEVTTKVEKKEKGYKQTLFLRDYDILKKVIVEANEKCPK